MAKPRLIPQHPPISFSLKQLDTNIDKDSEAVLSTASPVNRSSNLFIDSKQSVYNRIRCVRFE